MAGPTADISILEPDNEEAFEHDVDEVTLKSEALGLLPKESPRTYRLTLTVSDGVVSQSLSSTFLSAAGTAVPWENEVEAIHSSPADGWYEVVSVASYQIMGAGGVWGAATEIGRKSIWYKVGDAPNRGFGKIENVQPCSTTLPKAAFIASSKCTCSVIGVPTGHSFVFELKQSVKDPTGTVRSEIENIDSPISGGGTDVTTLSISFDNAQAIPGNWTNTVSIRARDNDTVGAEWYQAALSTCQFKVEAASSGM